MATTPGSSLLTYQSSLLSPNGVNRSLQDKLSDVVSIKDFGAKGDGVTDDTAAIAAWLSYLTEGSHGYVPAGTYIFKQAQTIPTLNNISITGAGSRSTAFVYSGTITTGDLFTIGDGTTSLTGFSISGIRFDSNVSMTSGAGLRIRRMQSGSNLFDVDAGLLGGTRNLYDGIWLDNVNVCKYSYGNFAVKNQGLKMNGAASSDEGSDIYLDNLTATFCGTGYIVGGGQGGVYFGKTLAFGNQVNYQIDNSIAFRKNREILFSSQCISDGCVNYGILINDTLTSGAPMSIDAFIASAGLVGTGGTGVNVYVKSWPNSRITMGSGQLFNATSHGMQVDDTTTIIDIDPSRHIFNNTGWGIYAPTSTQSVFFEGRAWNNGAGNFSPNSNVGKWTSYTTTVTSSVGTLGSVNSYGRYRRRGNTVNVEIVINVVDNGTGSQSLVVNVPFPTYDYGIIGGRENRLTGNWIQGLLSPASVNVGLQAFNNVYPAATGAQLILAGTYECQGN